MTSEIWRPSAQRVAAANLTRFMAELNARQRLPLRQLRDLYDWSINEPADFWMELARFAGVLADWGTGPALENPGQMPGARFFPGARLNFAQNLLRFRDEQPALIFRNERGARESSYGSSHAEVARVADGLRAAGVIAGDRVAGVRAQHSADRDGHAGRDAAWARSGRPARLISACGGVLDRFGQIAPSVLFTADGYFYAGKSLDSLALMAEVLPQMPSVERVVVIAYVNSSTRTRSVWAPPRPKPRTTRSSVLAPTPLRFEPLPFNHPLYILYSSGTTGVPSASCTAQAARCYNIVRSICCTRM